MGRKAQNNQQTDSKTKISKSGRKWPTLSYYMYAHPRLHFHLTISQTMIANAAVVHSTVSSMVPVSPSTAVVAAFEGSAFSQAKRTSRNRPKRLNSPLEDEKFISICESQNAGGYTFVTRSMHSIHLNKF